MFEMGMKLQKLIAGFALCLLYCYFVGFERSCPLFHICLMFLFCAFNICDIVGRTRFVYEVFILVSWLYELLFTRCLVLAI